MVEWFPSWIFYWRHIRYSNIGFSPKRYNLKKNNIMKQSAVEWLVDELQKADYIPKDSLIIDYVIKQSNKMFEQQIIEAGNSCAFKQHLHSERINKMSMDELEQYVLEPSYTFGEEYYSETFNK